MVTTTAVFAAAKARTGVLIAITAIYGFAWALAVTVAITAAVFSDKGFQGYFRKPELK